MTSSCKSLLLTASLYRYIGEGVPLASLRIWSAPTRNFCLGMGNNKYWEKLDNWIVRCHKFSGDTDFNPSFILMWIRNALVISKEYLWVKEKRSVRETFVNHFWKYYSYQTKNYHKQHWFERWMCFCSNYRTLLKSTVLFWRHCKRKWSHDL